MPVGSGRVDRPLGPFRFSTKVLERSFAGVSLHAARTAVDEVKRFNAEGTEESGGKSEKATAAPQRSRVRREGQCRIGDAGVVVASWGAASSAPTNYFRRRPRSCEGRGLNGRAGGGRLAEAVASTSRADVRCELPFAIHGRHRNKTRSQAGCGRTSLGIGAPAFAGTEQLARAGRAGSARHEGASGTRTGTRPPGARGIDVAAGRCVRRAFAGSRGGRGRHGAGLGGRDLADRNRRS